MSHMCYISKALVSGDSHDTGAGGAAEFEVLTDHLDEFAMRQSLLCFDQFLSQGKTGAKHVARSLSPDGVETLSPMAARVCHRTAPLRLLRWRTFLRRSAALARRLLSTLASHARMRAAFTCVASTSPLYDLIGRLCIHALT